ncbi:ABC transporter substrate-binding protein [Kaarinaea lacus]
MKYFSILIFMCCTVLVACNQSSSPGKNEVKHLGVLLFGDSRIPQSQGLIDGLKTFGFEENQNLKISLLNAKNDKKQLAPMVDQLVAANVDILVAGGGLEAEAIKSNTQKQATPTLVLYINAIIERSFIADRRNPGWEVTGVDNLNFELSGKRVVLLRDLVPSVNKILVLYYPNIKPSALGVEAAKEQAGKLGITIDARAVNSRDDINNIMSSLQPGDVDAMITVPTAPIDNAMKDIVLPHVERLALPLVTHSRKMVEAGALASYGAPFYELGKQAARLADKMLKGSKASSIPFETPTSYQLTVNEATLKRLNIEISNIAASQISEYIR